MKARREEAAAVAPKTPPSPLEARAPRPSVIRLRGSVVGGLVMSGAAILTGALTWAFVVQPDLRLRAAETSAREARDQGRGEVRPTGLVTDQPAAYDRLPPPRWGGEPKAEPTDPGRPEVARPGVSARPTSAARSAPADPAPGDLALSAPLFFDGGGESGPFPGKRDVDTSTASDGAAGGRADEAGWNPHRLTAPRSPYEIKAGVLAPAVLVTAVDGARPGPVVAVITRDVFDTVMGRHLLIPQGARLLGRSEGESLYGENRAYLVWERLLLPNGKSLALDDEPGVDAQGGVGVRGRVDRRLLPLAIGTLFGGAVTTLGQAARDRDRDGDRGVFGDAGNAAAIQGAQVAGRLIDRELTVRPSIRLEPGAPVGVLITRDLVLEPYQP